MEVAKFLTEGLHRLKIAVIGDVMLDRYYYGEVKRISPEAPVPVNRVRKMTSSLGGAANVAANLAGLECQVYIGGVTGQDENRTELEKLLTAAGIDCTGLLPSPKRETITKLRVVGANQQMVRLDFEEVEDLSPTETKSLEEWFSALVHSGLDGVIISDYAKGVCTANYCQKVITLAQEQGIPVLIDPKGSDWTKYQGCDFITPNLKEMCEAAGMIVPNENAPVEEIATQAQARYHIGNVVVTRSEKGMSLIGKGTTIHRPATAIEVFDVSGAGDTVAATLLAAYAGGLGLTAAVDLANKAAGIVVSKVGTYPVHRVELVQAILNSEREAGRSPGFLSREEAVRLAQVWRLAGEKIVFTNGCFDIIHAGHVTYLEKARQLGQHLIIGLNTDASVRRLKGETRPLVSERDRARVLAALGCVDAVVLFPEDTPTELVRAIRPDVLVKGGDYKAEEVAGREYAGRVEIIKFEEGYSTTGIITKIKKLVQEGKI